MNSHMKLSALFKTTLATALIASCCLALAESEGERSLRLENERQINDLNMRILTQNRDADDAVRAGTHVQPQRAQPTVTPAQAARKLDEDAAREAQYLLEAKLIGYDETLPLRSVLAPSTLKAIMDKPVRLTKFEDILPSLEFDRNSLYRQGNIVTLVFAQEAAGKGFAARRFYATCGGGKRSKALVASTHFGQNKEEAVRRARNPSEVGFEMPVEEFVATDKPHERIQALCKEAQPASFEIMVPVDMFGPGWVSVPVMSIRKAMGDRKISWTVVNHSQVDRARVSVKPAWDAPSAPIQRTVAIPGSISGGTQWSADCATGQHNSALVRFDDRTKSTKANPISQTDSLMKDLPRATQAGFELACMAAGLM